MTPRDRFLKTLRGEPHDRVPLELEMFHFQTHADIDAAPDPGIREIGHRVFEHTVYPVGVGTYINRYLVTPPQFWSERQEEKANGDIITTSLLETPKGRLTSVRGRNPLSQTQWQIEYPVKTMDDIDRIASVEFELHPDIQTPRFAELPDNFAERGYTRAGVSSPTVCVAGMMKYEMFLELCITEPDLIRDLTRICTDRILQVLDVVLAEKTIEYVWMGGCEWLTPPMSSPQLYADLVQPHEAEIIERIHRGGALAHVHCHGNVRDTLLLAVKRGADFFEPMEPPPDGDITMAEAKAMVAGRMTLGGNVEARILENEDEAAVEAATRAAFDGGTERMVLQTTAGPIGTMEKHVIRNYHRLIDVWEELA